MTVVPNDQARKLQAKRKNTLTGLKYSGLDLVPHKKVQKEKLAIREDLAKLRFQALKRDDKIMRALGEDWNDHGISARLAYALTSLTPKAWARFHADTHHEQVEELLDALIDTAEFLKCVVQLIECAHTRLIASACAARTVVAP